MRVLITGANGFIGKNIVTRLKELGGYEVLGFAREDSFTDFGKKVEWADAVVHLAGVNRSRDKSAFIEGNAELTSWLCNAIARTGRHIPLIVASSTQATMANPYGESKLAAEQAASALAGCGGNPVTIYRLPGVFGKWCRPNYNSVVATFCHNIANGLPIQIHDPATQIKLVYVDDVVSEFVSALNSGHTGLQWGEVKPIHVITLGELAARIEAFGNCRDSLIIERVGIGFLRALYATYVSYLPTVEFVYDLPYYGDDRGIFVEMLKTLDSGQFSFFTAYPGITRGGHYHHTKTEKFLVIKGSARFGFRNIVTDEQYEVFTSGGKPQVVETVPGWTHDITNVGEDELIVMLWANEIFDRFKPDTIACKV